MKSKVRSPKFEVELPECLEIEGKSEVQIPKGIQTLPTRAWFSMVLCISILLGNLLVFAQEAPKNSYWIQLKDKNGTPFKISKPTAFLSQRSIERRLRQHIAIDITDLPVSKIYVDSLKKLGLEIVHSSKWLNGVTVRTSDTALIKRIALLPFVVTVEFTKPAIVAKSVKQKFREESVEAYDSTKYGTAISQLTIMNGQFLHKQGIRGKGIQIAVLDAGFWHVDQINAFDSLRSTGRILGTRDFVDPKSHFYEQNTHGMSVLSCMAGNLPGNLIGTAPDASYYLIRTEDVATEYLIEEDNWVAGAEWADSLGVDVINSSLGYSEFFDPKMNHSYADMNGKKTRVTQGANMAFRKGILVFTSAGNEGNLPWKRIIAPSDGENVIGVAAIDILGKRASFSSFGPAFGGVVKPNVAAVGSGTYLVTSSGVPGYSNGTSFSSPVLAGMGACLLQANPLASVTDLKLAIEQSASQFNNPDSLLGYGIPDFEKADKLLKLKNVIAPNQDQSWAVSPNPFNDYLIIRMLKPETSSLCQIHIYNLQGVCFWHDDFKTSESMYLNNLVNLPDGILIMTIRSGLKEEQFKLIKLPR